jgi:alpha-mannosidase
LHNVSWQWHPGDLPHGENPGIDGGDWKPWSGELHPGKAALWVRGTVEVPAAGYNLDGAGLYFHMHPGPNGTTEQIVYLDGRRIAMGTDLEPQLVSASLHSGDIFHIAVKLLETDDPKRLTQPDLSLQFPAGRPDPLEVRSDCLAAALLLPALDSNPTQRQADIALVTSALNQINFAALDQNNQGAFDSSLRRASFILSPLGPKLRSLTIDTVGNSHIDAAWRWPWTETVDVVRRTFTTALQLMPEYPEYKYVQPDAQYDDWMEAKYPQIFSDMQRRAKQGRWQLVGGMWAEPDLNLPDGETMARQLLIGKRYMQSRFGTNVRIGWNVDSFGYSWQLPQVYKKAGVDFFVTQKMGWNEENKLPLKLFWWQSPDGSSVLTYFPVNYGGNTDPAAMASDAAAALPLAPGLKHVMHLYGVSDHGGGPTRVELDQAERLINSHGIFPQVAMSTPADFFAAVAPHVSAPSVSPVWNYATLAAGDTTLPLPATADAISVPVWRDELYLETHRGTYTTQARQKANMRASEVWMIDAEKLASIAWSEGAVPYPQEVLNDAWKKVLFNTNHDLAAGSGIGVIYKDAQVGYDAVHAATEATRALPILVERHQSSPSTHSHGRATDLSPLMCSFQSTLVRANSRFVTRQGIEYLFSYSQWTHQQARASCCSICIICLRSASKCFI